jgi:hypothetical protein
MLREVRGHGIEYPISIFALKLFVKLSNLHMPIRIGSMT